MAEADNPVTAVWSSNGGMSWHGKVPGSSNDFPMMRFRQIMVKQLAGKLYRGRDFSKDFPSDSAAFVLNESAVKFMGLKKSDW